MLWTKEIIRFTIPLLLKCNLKCKYCHVPNERNEYIDLDLFEKSLHFFFSSAWRQKDLVLYWWEPLLLWYNRLKIIFDILDKVKKEYKEKDIIVTLVSNLTILSPRIEDLLLRVDSISISMDWKELSHNINRWLFDLTYKNLKKLINNDLLKNKISLNKVVNKLNVDNFFEDIKYLYNEFKLDIYYNSALTVWDWDNDSLLTLNKELNKIYIYFRDNNLLKKIWNFFRIPLNSCPFWTLSLSLNWKIYNCEFMANDYINTHWFVIDLKENFLNLDIWNCSYNLTSKRCLWELCMWCWKFCTKFSFQNWNFLNKDKIEILKKVKNARFNHLEEYKKYMIDNKNSILNIQFFNISLNWVFKIFNFLYNLHKILWIKVFNVDIKYKNKKILILLLNKIILKSDIIFKINYCITELNDLIIDLDSSYAYDRDFKYLWNINSEIHFFK